MYCRRCGTQIPDSSIHCPSCGARVSGEAPTGHVWREPSFATELTRADTALAFAMGGSFLIVLGTLLPWLGAEGAFLAIGTFMPLGNIGVAILIVALLFLPATVIARSGAAGAWGMVMLLLSAVELAMIFQFLYFMLDNGFEPIGAGYWMAMVGGLGMGAGSVLQLLRASESNQT